MNAATNHDLVLVGPAPRGRPNIYDPVIADEICERLADGETMMSICRDERMPSRTTVWKWTVTIGEFSERYARARELQADFEADQLRELGDNPFIPPDHKKIMVGTRQWRAERMNRRVWAGSVKHEHELKQPTAELGADSLPPGLEFLTGRLAKGAEESEPGDS